MVNEGTKRNESKGEKEKPLREGEAKRKRRK